MIYYSTPFDLGQKIGNYYNSFMELLQDEDFACFIDGDAVFTTTHFGIQLNDIVKSHLDCGLFYATTNRVGCPWQKASGVDRDSNDMAYHRGVGKELELKYGTLCEDVSGNPISASGFLILVQKKLWGKLGGFLDRGILRVDGDFYDRARASGETIYLMKGVYLYHWYRGSDPYNTSHLTTVKHL